ncbi:MAG: TetR/AcrR family transcriptional regulator [Sneathiella sp.]|nr:TetR/AcrR family transcriptional regulator [Sneathiella sp.]
MSQTDFEAGEVPAKRGQRRRGRPKGSKSSNVAGEVTRAKLIEVSLELFSRQGFAGVSIGAVSDVSGVAKGSITHHFPNKKHLYQAVLEVVGSGLKSACLIAFDSSRPLGERLENLIDGIILWSFENEAQARMVAFELLGLSERGKIPPEWALTEHMENTMHLLTRGQEEELLVEDCSPLALLEVIFGLAVFSAIHKPCISEERGIAPSSAQEAQTLLRQSIFKSA